MKSRSSRLSLCLGCSGGVSPPMELPEFISLIVAALCERRKKFENDGGNRTPLQQNMPPRRGWGIGWRGWIQRFRCGRICGQPRCGYSLQPCVTATTALRQHRRWVNGQNENNARWVGSGKPRDTPNTRTEIPSRPAQAGRESERGDLSCDRQPHLTSPRPSPPFHGGEGEHFRMVRG